MINLRTICGVSTWALAILLVAGVSTSLAGQEPPSISGTVTDESGGVLPGVTVTATSETGGERTAVSNGQGRYEIANLPAGSYQVRAVLPGFSSAGAAVAWAVVGIPIVWGIGITLSKAFILFR